MPDSAKTLSVAILRAHCRSYVFSITRGEAAQRLCVAEECLYYIYGPTRSGKGTACETILAIFPRPIASEVDFNTFTAKREADTQNFDLAPLKPARIVFASESNKYQSLNPAKVKALTGGNLVSCAFKHKDTFSYRPLYTVWLSSNHELNADAEDSALWAPNTFSPRFPR